MSFSSVSEAYRQQQEQNLRKFVIWSLIASTGFHVAILPFSLNLLKKEALSEEAIEFIVVEETPPEVKAPAPEPEAAKPEPPEPEPTPEPEATPEPEPVKVEQPEPIPQPEPIAPLGATQPTPQPEQTTASAPPAKSEPVETPQSNEPVTPPVSPPQPRTNPTNPLENITPPNTPPETTEPPKDTTPDESPVPPEPSRSEAPAPSPIRPGNSNPQDLFNDPGNPTEPTTPSEPNPTSTGSNDGGIDVSDPFNSDSGAISDAPVAPNVTPITPSTEAGTGELFGETPDIASNPGSSDFDPSSSIGGNDGDIDAGDPFDGSSGAMDNSPLGSEPVAPISPGGGSSGGGLFEEGESYDMAGNPGGSYDPGSTSSFGGDSGIGESDGFGDSVGPMSGLPPAGDPAGDPTSTRGSGPPTCFNCNDDPIYPPRAVENGWEGQVQVSFTVNPDGSVSNVTIISRSPYEELNNAAIETAYNFQFSPSDNGIPNHSLGIRFKLNGRGGGFGSY